MSCDEDPLKSDPVVATSSGVETDRAYRPNSLAGSEQGALKDARNATPARLVQTWRLIYRPESVMRPFKRG